MYELQVEGMTCGGCVRSVTRSVQAVDAGAKVDVDLTSKKVRIHTGAGLNAITSAIIDAGYQVTASTAV
jgi:copper chaperone